MLLLIDDLFIREIIRNVFSIQNTLAGRWIRACSVFFMEKIRTISPSSGIELLHVTDRAPAVKKNLAGKLRSVHSRG